MKIVVCMHGKTKDKRILELLEEYKLKISRYQKIDLDFLPLPPAAQGGVQNGNKIVENILEKYQGKSAKLYFLDEDGKEFTSVKFAENYEKGLNQGFKEVVFVVGPAEGFFWDKGNLGTPGKSGGKQNYEVLSLSKLAMQHDLAGLVLMEQIYRAVSIKNNLPYHKI